MKATIGLYSYSSAKNEVGQSSLDPGLAPKRNLKVGQFSMEPPDHFRAGIDSKATIWCECISMRRRQPC